MKNEKDNKDKYAPLVLLFIIIIVLWAISAFIIFQILPDMNTRGSFGDMFGAINALFSGGALAGVVYAIFLQKKELSLQRKELEYTRKELKRSAEAQEKSEQALSRQAESLKATAKLNGLSTLLSHNDTMRSSRERYGTSITDINNESADIARIIKEIISKK